jgi:hypothetical protein
MVKSDNKGSDVQKEDGYKRTGKIIFMSSLRRERERSLSSYTKSSKDPELNEQPVPYSIYELQAYFFKQ